MTDRELLEMAAKAAGIPVPKNTGWEGISSDGTFWWSDDCEGRRTRSWNPITDDGDALRLAVKLHINIEHLQTLAGRNFHEVSAWPVGRGDCLAVVEIQGDQVAATRRAIVRAAAEIGKSMP